MPAAHGRLPQLKTLPTLRKMLFPISQAKMCSLGIEARRAVLLCRLQPLPWEADPRFFAKCLDPSAAAFVGDLLMRSPDARKPIRTIIHAPMFEPVLSDLAFDTNLASASGRSLSLNLASASSRDLDAGRA